MTEEASGAAGSGRYSSANRRVLKLLVLSDGLPGHGNQARGLVQWMKSRYVVDYEELDVRLQLKPLARLLMPTLLRMGFFGCYIIKIFYQYKSPGITPDLIISAGGNTSFLNVALSRLLGVSNIFLGSKRRLRSNDFSAHLTLEPTGEPHNIVMELVPTLTDIGLQKEQGEALRRSLGIDSDKPLYALVIGGNGAGFKYDDYAWQQIADITSELSQRDNCLWLVTTSRRTGSKGEQILKNSLDPAILADAVWWNEAPRKVMNAYLGAANVAYVTADSMSMVNECIASELSTVLLEPEGANPDEHYRSALSRFIDAGYCSRLRLGERCPELTARKSVECIRDKLLNELDALLEKI